MSPEEIKYRLWKMGLIEVVKYISNHSTTEARARRLSHLYQKAVRGEVFDVDHTRPVPLRQEYKPIRLEALDEPGFWL